MCKVSRENKKEEAIKRMQALGLFKPCIKAFTKYDEVQLSEPTGGLYEFADNEELNAKIKEFEADNDALVYHVIHTYTQFGELYNFLFVGDYEEDWDIDDLGINNGYVLAYVWNKSDEWMSEMGDIMVQGMIGGLIRIA